MKFKKLNRLVDIYRLNKDQLVFAKIYEEVVEERQTHERLVVRSGYGDAGDAESLFNETLLTLVERIDVVDFGKMLSGALRTARFCFYRREKRHRQRYVLDSINRDAGDEAPTSNLTEDEFHLEVSVIENLTKKKRDQQYKLLISLHESARIPFDSKMVDAIEELPRFSIEALAKALGLKRNTIARKLKRLERAYVRIKHGDIADYIPSSLRIKREHIAS
jgi:DNA-directed RNA polymerase specialized sigma24 family protein